MNRAVYVPIVIVLAWWAISVTRSLSVSREAGQDPAREPAEQSVQSANLNFNSVAKPVVEEKVSKGSSVMVRPFEFQNELTVYLDLQTKVFLSDSEKREKADLLRNAALIRALGARLQQASRSHEVMREQDAAIDLLLEALKDGDTQAASEVLREVIQDSQVEDLKLDKGSREQLAGLKAEVLYQWSATNPQIASNLQSWLPGPVSKKIWDNVLRMQQSNEAEGAAEARANHH